MKSLKNLICAAIVPVVALFVACTEETPDAGVWVDEPAVAFDESSSSILEVSSAEEITDLSSSAEVVSSSSSFNVKTSSSSVPSSSVGYGEGEINLPIAGGCKPPIPRAPAPRYAPAMVTDTATYGVIPFLTKERVKVLVQEGMPEDSAIYQARSELFRELGIDTLLDDIYMTALQLEYTLYYLYAGTEFESVHFEINLNDDLSDGSLETESYCFNQIPYDELNGDPIGNMLTSGCVVNESDFEIPLTIMQNIWRKCAGLPYCNDSVGDTVVTIGEDHFVCRDGKWATLDQLNEEKGGIFCENDYAEVIAIENGDSVKYLCYEGKWHDLDHTGDLPAEFFFNPDFDYGFFTDSRDGHIYRTTIYNGQTWFAQDIDYYNEADTLFTKHSICYKNARNVANRVDDRSYCDGGSRYYTMEASKKACPEGWRLPTTEDWPQVNFFKDGTDVAAFFSKNSGVDEASDAYGLSLRRHTGINNVENVAGLGRYNTFWLEDFIALNNGKSVQYVDGNAFGEGAFYPVRCIKE